MLAGPHAEEFIRGEMQEITNLWELGCWEEVEESDVPAGTRVLPTTWAYKYRRSSLAH